MAFVLLTAPFSGASLEFDTFPTTQPGESAAKNLAGTLPDVSAIATHQTATVVADDDTFLGVEDIAVRYGIGRTKAYDLVREPGFPRSVVPGMTRIPLRALRAYEMAHSLATTVAAASAPVAPVVLAPLAARAAGRPKSKAAA